MWLALSIAAREYPNIPRISLSNNHVHHIYQEALLKQSVGRKHSSVLHRLKVREDAAEVERVRAEDIDQPPGGLADGQWRAMRG